MRLLLLTLALAAPLAAKDRTPTRTVAVVNDTDGVVNQLFVTGGEGGGKLRDKVSGILGHRADARDRLGSRTLARGDSAPVELRADRCRYDVRAVLEDGRTLAARDVDLCAADRWPLSRAAAR